jgi:hypothetical protein
MDIGWMHRGGAAKSAAAFGDFGFRQVPSAGARAQHFSASRNLETFGHGLLGFDAFGTSHNSIRFPLEKEHTI